MSVCIYCGRQCLDPHTFDTEEWETCKKCGYVDSRCQCYRCDGCRVILDTEDEQIDGTCQKCKQNRRVK
jgi:hypothetical protein